jgi:3-oxoacyl-[acyl-carrier protein] reductase
VEARDEQDGGEAHGRGRQDHQPVVVHHRPHAAGYAAYVATKGAVEQFSHVLAKELGPRNITVNVVSPGPTDTELFGEGKTEEQKQRFARMAALGRLGQPQDIADMVALLVGEDARWITGQNLRAKGGLI